MQKIVSLLICLLKKVCARFLLAHASTENGLFVSGRHQNAAVHLELHDLAHNPFLAGASSGDGYQDNKESDKRVNLCEISNGH